ncbi:MAG: hypothetical protein WEA31_09870 [Pirellulales bacterium]
MSDRTDFDSAGESQPLKSRSRLRDHWRSRRPSRSMQLLGGGLFLLGFLALLVAFLPRILARTDMRHSWVADALPGLQGKVEVDALEVGWFTPIELIGLKIYEPDGKLMLSADRLALNHGMWAMLTGGAGKAEYQIERPIVYARVRPGTSNIDEYLLPALVSDGESAPLKLGVTNGELRVFKQHGLVAAEALQTPDVVAENVTVDLLLEQPGSNTNSAAFHASILAGTPRPGKFNGKFVWPSSRTNPAAAGQPAAVGGTVEVLLENVEAAALDPAIMRWSNLDVDLDGPLNGKLACGVGTQQGMSVTTIEGNLTGANTNLRAPAYLGPNTVRLGQSTLQCAMTLRGSRLEIRQASFDSAAGDVSASGRIDWNLLRNYQWPTTAAGWYALAAEPPQADGIEELQLRGQLDVAFLGQQAPTALSLREGVDLQSGTIDILLTIASQDAGRTARGRVGATALKALAGGKQLVWQQPVEVNLEANQTHRGMEVKRLVLQSDTGVLEASGTVERSTVAGNFDLDRLVSQSSQFVNLGDLKLAGQLDGTFDLRRTLPATNPPRPVGSALLTAQGQMQLRNLVADLGAWGVFREPRATVTLNAVAATEGPRLVSMESLAAEVLAGGDDLKLTLQKPVAMNTPAHYWPWSIALKGRLAKWRERIPQQYLGREWDVDGDGVVTGMVAASRAGVAFQNLHIAATDFVVRGPGVNIREPRIDLRSTGNWSLETGQGQVAASQLQTSTLAMATEGLQFNTQAWQARGAVGARGDLARLRTWFGPQSTIGRWWQDLPTSGEFVADVTLSESVGKTRCQWNLVVTNFALLQPVRPPQSAIGLVSAAGFNTMTMQTLFTQPKITWTGVARYDAKTKLFELDQSKLQSQLANFDFAGDMQLATSPPSVNLAGNASYDLGQLATAAGIGSWLTLTGQGVEPFWVKVDTRASGTGATSTQATGEAAIAFGGGQWVGLPIGPGKVQVQLTADGITIPTFETTLSEGRVRLGGKIPLYSDGPLHLQATPGRVAENVRLTPEACRGWFMYFAPIVAETAQAEGRITLQLDRGIVPLGEPKASDFVGTLAVSQGQVRPGPLAWQLIVLGRQLEAIAQRRPLDAVNPQPTNDVALQIPPQNLRFRVAQQRVWHDSMVVTIGDVTVRTTGSVGFDQSLDMVAEMPILAKWVERDRVASSLAGQVVRIPIRGTVSQPQIDNQMLQRLAGQMTANAANSIINQELQRQFDRLLPR